MKQTVLVLITLAVVAGLVFMVRQGKRRQFGPADVSPTSSEQPETQSSQGAGEQSQATQESPVISTEVPLDIELPINNSTVNTSSVLVKGKTAPSLDVFVNEKELKADGQGNFSISIYLEEGENYILIFANDEVGNYSEREIVVNLETVQ